MSAPTTHDPLVVNTQDGSCWMRRAVTRDGHGLYALAGSVAGVPDEVLATIPELAADHRLASMAFALPMPMGPEPRTLDRVEDELTGVSLSLYEEQLDTARLRLALASAKRWRRGLRFDLQFAEGSRQRWRTAAIAAEAERDALRAEVAELRAERHSTNEALSDAAEALRARRSDEPVETVTVLPAEDVTPQVAKLRDLLAGQRTAVEDPHDGPLAHRYRVPRDLPPLGGAQ